MAELPYFDSYLHNDEQLSIFLQEFALQFQAVHLDSKRLALVEALMSYGESLLPFVFSQVDGQFIKILVDLLVVSFPATLAEYLRDPIPVRVLNHIGSFYLSLPSNSVPGIMIDFHACSKATAAIQALDQLSLNRGSRDSRQSQNPGAEKKMPLKSMREAFAGVGSSFPVSSEEALALEKELIRHQREVLKKYLDVLRTTDVIASTRQKYLGSALANRPQIRDHEALADSTFPTNVPDYPIMQARRATQLFEDEETGTIGDWPIVAASRAMQDLRGYRRDEFTFKLIKRKLCELSQGLFSQSNHSRLVGRVREVPIFVARVIGDIRVVYQVDYGELGSLVRTTVSGKSALRAIYGFADLIRDIRLWSAVASQSRKKGKLYRDRCLYRGPVGPNARYSTLPATFPGVPGEEPLDTTYPTENEDLSEECMLELHTILGLERFIPVSHTTLKSILANENPVHAFLVSPQEDEIIYHDSSCYVIGRSGTGKTTTMAFKMAVRERDASEQGVKIRQLFVTKSRYLAGRVGEFFTKLYKSLLQNENGNQYIALAGNTLMEEDDDDDDEMEGDDEAGMLPKRYSELRDDHFPLFLSFDRLARLLEANYSCSAPITTSKFLRRRPQELVTYDQFLDSYWPHFNQKLTKNLDPALIFSEFLGVIKGSENALQNMALSRDEYLSTRARSTLNRETVYDLFETYSRHKGSLEGYDSADRAHKLLRSTADGFPGRRIDFLYIDEAQDHLIIESKLLKSLCCNPKGLFWAGDTAQAIAIGSSFRFEDLKAFLHRIENDDLLVKLGWRKAVHPTSFSLSVNYRSHSGIVDCAQLVIDCIKTLFPNSIDNLKSESGIVSGPKPVFFSGLGDDCPFDKFLFGGGNLKTDFGAEQAILVRSESTQKVLRKLVGDRALVLTLLESKGLEFDDVLLYNVFEDSSASAAAWRVVLNMLPLLHVPAADHANASICTELKSLYVGITRARNRCWIWDMSAKGELMKRLWLTKNLIKTCSSSEGIPRLASRSTPEEWGEKARELFSEKLYEQAGIYFGKAGKPEAQAICKAYYLRKQARAKVPRTPADFKDKSASLLRAAEEFSNCARNNEGRRMRLLSHRAARCFEDAGYPYEAAQAFEKAQEYTAATGLYRQAGRFDEAVSIIKEHGNKVDPEVAGQVLGVAKIHYARENELEKAKDLFDSEEQVLEFLGDFGFGDQQVTVLTNSDRWEELGDLCRQQGKLMDAIKHYRRSSTTKDRAIDCLIQGFWEHYHLGSEGRADNSLVALAAQYVGDRISRSHQQELEAFLAIHAQDGSRLIRLADYHLETNPEMTLLCYDYALNEEPTLQLYSIAEIANLLTIYLKYATSVQNCISLSYGDGGVQRLLGYRVASGQSDHFLIQKTSILYNQQAFDCEESNIILPRNEVAQIISTVLRKRLANRLNILHKALSSATSLRPCLNYSVSRTCKHVPCERSHQDVSTKATYNARIQVHLHIIRVLNQCRLRRDKQRQWLDRFFEALHPVHYPQGNIALLTPSLIPDWDEGVKIMNEWIKARLFLLRPVNRQIFLGVLISTSMLLFDFNRRYAAGNAKSAPAVNPRHPPPSWLIRPEDYSSYSIVHDILIFIDGLGLSITRCVLALSHIVEWDIPLDFSVFSVLLERLATRITIAERSARLGEIEYLHSLTIPRSWIPYALNDPDRDRNVVEMTSILLDCLQMLLAKMLDSLNVSQDRRPPLIPRAVFVSRVCRVMVFLGDNSNREQCRRVHDIMRSFQKHPIQHNLFEGYFAAQSWDHLRYIFCSSFPNPQVDELVHLVKGNHHYFALDNVRLLRFQTKNDIQQRLGLDFIVPTGSQNVANPLRSTKQAISSPSVLPADSSPNGKIVDIKAASASNAENPDTNHELVESEVAENDEIGNTIGTHPHENPVLDRTTRVSAACTIANFYRGTQKRARVQRSLSHYYLVLCWKGMSRLQVPGTPMSPSYIQRKNYRRVFLWHLPHALAFVEVALRQFAAAKEKAKMDLKTSKHQCLEYVQETITALNKQMGVLRTVSKSLHPSSSYHDEMLTQKLWDDIKKVVNVVKDVQGKDWALVFESEMEKDYKCGVTYLANPPPKPPTLKLAKRPILNTEDLDM